MVARRRTLYATRESVVPCCAAPGGVLARVCPANVCKRHAADIGSSGTLQQVAVGRRVLAERSLITDDASHWNVT